MIIHLDSKDCSLSTLGILSQKEDFSLVDTDISNTFPDVKIPVNGTFTHNTKCKITSTEMNIGFHQFSQSFGNTAFFIDNVLIRIPNKNYSSSFEITQSLNDTITQIYGTGNQPILFSVDGDNDQNYIFITSLSTDTVKLSFHTSSSTISFSKYDIKSKLGWSLGFRSPFYSIITGSILRSESIFNKQPIRNLFLGIVFNCSGNMLQKQKNTFGNKIYHKSDIFSKLMIDHIPDLGSISFFSLQKGNLLSSEIEIQNNGHNSVQIQECRVSIFDEFGRPFFLNGCEFSLTLEFD